jgi:hypothetical protein
MVAAVVVAVVVVVLLVVWLSRHAGPEVRVGSLLWVRRPSRDRAFCAPQEGSISSAGEQRLRPGFAQQLTTAKSKCAW